jgi:excisionase family DNA binding protein
VERVVPKPDHAIPVHIGKRDATVVLGCSMPTLDTLIKTGRLPAYRFGPRSLRLKLSDVEALLEPVTSTAKAVGE